MDHQRVTVGGPRPPAHEVRPGMPDGALLQGEPLEEALGAIPWSPGGLVVVPEQASHAPDHVLGRRRPVGEPGSSSAKTAARRPSLSPTLGQPQACLVQKRNFSIREGGEAMVPGHGAAQKNGPMLVGGPPGLAQSVGTVARIGLHLAARRSVETVSADHGLPRREAQVPGRREQRGSASSDVHELARQPVDLALKGP